MSATVRVDFTAGGLDTIKRAVTSIVQETEKAARHEVQVAARTSERVAKIKKEGAAKANRATEDAAVRSLDKEMVAFNRAQRRKQEALGASMAMDVRETERAAKRKESIEAASLRRKQTALGTSMSQDIAATERANKRKEQIDAAALRRKQTAQGASMSKDITAAERVARRRQEILGASMAMDVRENERAARRKQESLGASMAKDVELAARASKQKEEIERRSSRKREEIHASRLNAGFREQDRADRREASLAARKEARAAKASESATRGTFSETGQGAARGFRTAAGVLAAGGGIVAGAIGTGGIIAGIESEMDLESQAAQLQTDVRSGNDAFIDRRSLIRDSRSVAGYYGIKAEDVMGAMGTAASQGGGLEGLNAFRGDIGGWGQLALASGTKLGDLASISATMTNNGIKDSATQLMLARNINAAAKTGNVGFREMASTVQEVAGAHQAQGFDGTAQRRIELASGMIQMARLGGAGSAPEAATSARAYMADLLGSKASKFMSANGIQAYKTNDKGQKVAKDVEELTIELFRKTKGDPQKLGAIFDQRSLMTKSAIDQAYKQDGEAGIKKLFAEYTSARQSDRQVRQEAENIRGTSASQIAQTMEQFKAQVGSELLPVMVQLIPHFKDLAQGVAGVAKDFSEAPKTMIAKFLALATAAGAAQGALASVAGRMSNALLDKLMGRVATMNVTAGAVNMAGQAGAMAGANPLQVAAAGVGGFLVGQAAFKATEKTVDEDLRKTDTRGAAMEAESIMGAMRSGRERKGDRERLLEIQKQIQTEQNKGAWDRFSEGTGKAWDKLGKEGLSLGGVSDLALRGVGDAIYGGQQAGDDKTSKDALKGIAEVLAKPQPQPDVVAAISDLKGAIVASNLQGPKNPGK